MQISELILELQNVQEDHGDIAVVVQYRDQGGAYSGWDEDISPFVDKGKCII